MVSGQNRIIDKLEKILLEVSGLRAYVIEKNSLQDSQIATLTANQQAVLNWEARIEGEQFDHP